MHLGDEPRRLGGRRAASEQLLPEQRSRMGGALRFVWWSSRELPFRPFFLGACLKDRTAASTLRIRPSAVVGKMTRIEHRKGFDILLEAPPSHKSLWAAMVRASDILPVDTGAHLCLACTREAAISDARAFIDSLALSDLSEVAASESSSKQSNWSQR
jgi:hypothetical protein